MKNFLKKLIREYNETSIVNTKYSRMKQFYCIQTSNAEMKPLTRLSLICLTADTQNWRLKTKCSTEIAAITFQYVNTAQKNEAFRYGFLQ